MNIVINHDAGGLIKALMRPEIRRCLSVLEKYARKAHMEYGIEGVQHVLAEILKQKDQVGMNSAMMIMTCVAVAIEVVKTAEIGLEQLQKQQGSDNGTDGANG